MKHVLIVFSLLLLALAQGFQFNWFKRQPQRDWSKIINLDVSPFQTGYVNVNRTHSRIVGGSEAVPNSFPYQAALFLKIRDRIAFCGGSIISEDYVLSAAHCLYQAKEAEVVVGAHKIKETEVTQQRIISKEFIIHKGWHPIYLTSDIAVVKLPQKIIFNKAVQPIRLPRLSDIANNLANLEATVSGWGKDSDAATAVSPVLRYLTSTTISEIICKLFYFGVPGKNHVCISGQGSKSACSGDSGGPLTIVESDGQITQIGVVSFGIAFGCEIGWPSVFTRVNSFVPWIQRNTGIPVRE